MDRYELVYLPFRGRGEAVRLLFALAGVPFVDTRIPFAEWPQVKKTMPLGQVPVLHDRAEGDLVIPQSAAILRHLGRAHGLYGRNAAEQARIDVAGDTVTDARDRWVPVAYPPSRPKEPAVYAQYRDETLPLTFTRLAHTLGEGPFIAGDAPSWADVYAFDLLDAHEHVWADVLAPYPRLEAHVARVRALPRIAAHLAARQPSELPRRA